MNSCMGEVFRVACGDLGPTSHCQPHSPILWPKPHSAAAPSDTPPWPGTASSPASSSLLQGDQLGPSPLLPGSFSTWKPGVNSAPATGTTGHHLQGHRALLILALTWHRLLTCSTIPLWSCSHQDPWGYSASTATHC